ncbi:MAG TPA: DUF427 domain-containing protein [Candidatus Limnocylindrales bacterium]|jgi:uncharacterized protein (DUF427 family)
MSERAIEPPLTTHLAGTVAPPIDREIPGPGQESVWDYPRPPRVEAVPVRLRVVVDGDTLAETDHGLRVLETAGPPVYYFPPSDVRLERLVESPHGSVCEWKGQASYRSYEHDGRRIDNVGWVYENPLPGYESLRGHLAFYAGRVTEAWVGDERATPQPGHFYGGWVTSNIVGPFKGSPGSAGW